MMRTSPLSVRSYFIAIPLAVMAFAGMYLASTATGRPELLHIPELGTAYAPGEELSGGATSGSDSGRNAFGRSPMNIDKSRWPPFLQGKVVFDRDWSDPSAGVVRAASFFNASSCKNCHMKDGRGRPPLDAEESPQSIVFQLSRHGDQGAMPDPLYGDQLDYHGADGRPGEGTVEITYQESDGEFADGEPFTLIRPRYRFRNMTQGPFSYGTRFSPRVSPAIFGLGLLEALPEESIIAHADPGDRDGDGISGRPNYVPDVREGKLKLGRFGWKANQPSVETQVARALLTDMGLTTELFPMGQGIVRHASDNAPAVTPKDFQSILLYTRLLAVPRRRGWEQPQVLRGKGVFGAIGCNGCHISQPMTTGVMEGFPEISGQRIFPYTDLLLHDMGDDLADGRPDGLASGNEWRTPPLWGIGLVKTVSGHTRFLHDGRARSIEEAILWHGGEGDRSREKYVRLPKSDRAALLRFLESL